MSAPTFHYLIFVWGDVEPEAIGPFSSGASRDAAALSYRRQHGSAHGYFRASVRWTDREPALKARAYEATFFNFVEGKGYEAQRLGGGGICTLAQTCLTASWRMDVSRIFVTSSASRCGARPSLDGRLK